MVETGTLILMATFALLAIHSRMLRLAVIHMAVFSLLGAFLYLQFAAPELAIAEAAIGSGLVTLLYLAALKRNKVYTIAILAEGHKYRLTDAYLAYCRKSREIRAIRNFFSKREFEPQIIFSDLSLGKALSEKSFDLVMKEEKDGFSAYGSSDNYVLEELELMFQIHNTGSGIKIIRRETTNHSENN